jgi:hypothetical protein
MRLLAAVLGLTTLLSAQVKPVAESLVLTNVNVIDTRDGLVQHNMTVLVEEGRIRSVAHFGLIAAGRGLRVVNAAGKYLIPGLWDMHAHIAEDRATWNEKIIYPLYVANGVTGVRDMGGDPKLLAERRQRLDRGEIVGPHVFVEARASSSVTSANYGGTDRTRELDSVRALSDSLRDAYVRTTAEISEGNGSAGASDAVGVGNMFSGQRSVEHFAGVLLGCSSQEQVLRQQSLTALAQRDLDSFSSLRLQTIATYDPNKASHLFVELSNHGTWQVPTLVWSQTMSSLDKPPFSSDPRLAYTPNHLRAQWDPKILLQHLSATQLATVKVEAARDLVLAGAMHRAGLQFMAGTDAPDPYVVPGFSLHDELEWLVKSGFSTTQALQAATFNPALFMVKLDQYGVVEKNHVADLVLLDANPLEDIRNTRKISAVVLGGKFYSRLDLDHMLEEAKTEAAKE